MPAHNESSALSVHGDQERKPQHQHPNEKTLEERKRYADRIAHETGILADLTGRQLLKDHLYVVHIRTLLARCSVAQATICELDCKPWTQSAEEQARSYYSEMLDYATKAKNYANILAKRELKARCNYWVGRAFGGTRDWQNAANHFKDAIEFDVSNDPVADARLGLKGLRLSEKEDVRFLWQDTTRRNEERMKRASEVTKAIAKAVSESEEQSRAVEDLNQDDGPNGLAWRPERDRKVFDENIKLARNRKLRRESTNLDENKLSQIERDVEEKVKKEWDEKGTAYMTRRVLSEEERCYIYHGSRWKQHRNYTGQRICPRCAQHWATKRRNRTNTTLSSATHISSPKASPTNSLNLDHEIERAWTEACYEHLLQTLDTSDQKGV